MVVGKYICTSTNPASISSIEQNEEWTQESVIELHAQQNSQLNNVKDWDDAEP